MKNKRPTKIQKEIAKEDGFKFLFNNVLDTPSNRETTKNYSKSQREYWF